MRRLLCSILVITVVVIILAVLTKPVVLDLKMYCPHFRRVVCSLTTRPNQPYYFDLVLDSLVSQFDAVYLALPRVSRKGVPYPFISHSGVTVISVDEDLGPITKFFGVLNSREPADTLVVVLDDDVVYNSKLRETYERAHHRYPNAVLSGAGMVYKYAHLGLPWFLSMSGRRENYTSFLPSFLMNRNLTTVCGYTGICFRRRLLDRDKLLDFIRYWNTDKICFLNDDIVISAFFASRSISRLWIRTPRCRSKADKRVESLSGKGQINMFFDQDRAYQRLRDCFRKDPSRLDCLCGMDLLLIVVISVIMSYGSRKSTPA